MDYYKKFVWLGDSKGGGARVRKSVQWQLAPSILLTNPSSTNSDPNVRLFIDTEKSLSYAPDLGWNWHKSWNLPNISIRLEVKVDKLFR